MDAPEQKDSVNDPFYRWGFLSSQLLSGALPSREFVARGLVVDLYKFVCNNSSTQQDKERVLFNYFSALLQQTTSASATLPSVSTVWSRAKSLVAKRTTLAKSSSRASGAQGLKEFDEGNSNILCFRSRTNTSTSTGSTSSSSSSTSRGQCGETVCSGKGVFDQDVSADVCSKLASECHQLTEKLSKLEGEHVDAKTVANLQRREKRKSLQVTEQRAELKKIKKENRELEEEVLCKDDLKTEQQRLRKQVVYWKTECSKLRQDPGEVSGNVENEDLHEQLLDMKEKNAELAEEITRLENEQLGEVVTMAGTRYKVYTAGVRKCCLDLLSRNVGINNVEPVIRSVASLCGRSLGRLPKPSTLAEMYIEGASLAQSQLCEVLSSSENVTLHSDGTTKFGQKYLSFQVGVGDDMYSLGMREVFSGSAQATLDKYVQIVDDIERVSGERDAAMKITAALKNTMSDRHAVQKSFNGLLQQYRCQILPAVVSGWAHLGEAEQQSMCSMHNFFCGMHLVVNMAETVSETLKVYENLHFGGNAAGAALLPANPARTSKESGVVRLVRTSCKALEKHGSEQSGYPEDFAAYLSSQGIDDVPLDTFRGNRFNILFHNAAGVFYLNQHMSSFLENIFEKPNLLLQAVAADLKEPVFIAGVRALGLVDKHLTSPLWRVLEDKTVSLLDMNNKYHKLCEFLRQPDAAGFITGESVPFPEVPIKKDAKWLSLVAPANNDAETMSILQCLFSALLVLVLRLVADHLPGGHFHKPSEEVREQVAKVSKTNTVSERDFAMLDRLMREKPNSSTAALEGMILYSHNKTDSWLQEKSADELEELFQKARQCSPQMYQAFRRRRQSMLEDRRRALKQQEKEVAEKRKKKSLAMETLVEEITKCGLFKSVAEVDEALSKCSSETSRVSALHLQLKFRKNVLCQEAPSSTFAFSKDGKKHSSEQLRENLLSLLQNTAAETV
eukprot:scpid41604/ scgid27282/ 